MPEDCREKAKLSDVGEHQSLLLNRHGRMHLTRSKIAIFGVLLSFESPIRQFIYISASLPKYYGFNGRFKQI